MHKNIIKKNLTEKNIVRTLEQPGNEVFDSKKTRYRQEFEVYQIKYKDTDAYRMIIEIIKYYERPYDTEYFRSFGVNVSLRNESGMDITLYNVAHNCLNAYHERISYVNRYIIPENLFIIDKGILGKSKNEVLEYLIDNDLLRLPGFIDSDCSGEEFVKDYENIIIKSKLDKLSPKRDDLKISRIIELINTADEIIKVMISEYNIMEE